MTNIAFGLLDAVTYVAGVARSFGCNESTIYCLQACFQQSGSEKDKSETTDNDVT